jgi:hypothetical protein
MTAYGTVAQFKTRTDRDEALSAAWTTAIEEILNAISRKIDNICKVPENYFVADAVDVTKTLSGTGTNYLKIPHAVSITTLSAKVDYDDTVYVAWATPSTTYAGDGDWYAIAGIPNKPIFDLTPYTYLMIDPNGNYSYFPRGHKFWNIQLIGKFGYSAAVPPDIREVCLAETTVLTKRFQGVMDDSLTNTDMGQLIYRIRMSDLSRDAREFLLAGGWISTMYNTQV